MITTKNVKDAIESLSTTIMSVATPNGSVQLRMELCAIHDGLFDPTYRVIVDHAANNIFLSLETALEYYNGQAAIKSK